MSQTAKVLIIVFSVIIFVIGLVIFLYYYFFVGITKKAKYEKCAHTCEEIMLLDSDIPACKLKCTQISGYSPSDSGSSSKSDASTSSKESKESSDKTYDCQYVWPQQIIEKDSKDLVIVCPYSRPWCRPGDGSYEDISCCANYSETTKEKTDCQKLPDLIND